MATLRVDFKSNTAGFQKGLNAVKTGIGGLAAIAGTVLAPIAALAAAVGGIGIAFKGISLAADMESMEASFTTMLGSGEKAKAMVKDIQDLGARTPFEFPDLAQAARSLMAGGQKEGIIATLTTIGDLAAVAQKPVAELASIYSKIKSGGILQAEDLNQLTDNGIPILQEFSRMLGVSVMQVRKLGSEGKLSAAMMDQAFAAMTSKGGVAYGAMVTQSRTFNGLLSTLKDNWNTLLAAFGRPVMESLKPALSDGITLLDSMQAKARAFGEATAKAVTFLRHAFKGGELVSLATSGFVLAAQSFVNVLVKGMTAAGGVLFNAFEAAGQLIFGIFTNSAMWDSLKATFDGIGLTIQKAILEAIPSNWLDDKEGSMAHVNDLIERRGNAADNYGERAGRDNAALFVAAGDKLKESGRVFAEVFRDVPRLFNTDKRFEDLRKRWDALSKPDAPAPATPDATPAKGVQTPAAKPPVSPLKTNFEPIVSSLARIGGASAITSNPLVSLHQKTNDLLTKVVENTKAKPSGAPAAARYA